MESNKIFAAVLIAGILAMLAGFVSQKLVHEDVPTQYAYSIEPLDDGTSAGKELVQVITVEPILGMLASADVDLGARLSRACAACHTFEKGGANRVGPNLWNIIGSKHAHADGYAYSDAMKALHSKDWTYADLNLYLWNPRTHIPGTKMVFAGLKKPEDRAAMIAWLRSLSDNPQPLPSAGAIAAETEAGQVEPEADLGAPAVQPEESIELPY